jgi:hypothetical protein
MRRCPMTRMTRFWRRPAGAAIEHDHRAQCAGQRQCRPVRHPDPRRPCA